MGAIRGPIPFSLADGDAINAIAKGTVTATVAGIPLSMSFDLGTATGTRGLPNRLRFAFDHDRLPGPLADKESAELQRVRSDLERLDNERAALYRKWKSADDKLRLPAPPAITGPELPDTSLIDEAAMPTSQDTLVPDPGSEQVPKVIAGMDTRSHHLDDLSRIADARYRRLKEMEARVERLHREEERLTALMRAKQQQGAFQRLVSKVRRLGFGSVTPTRSAFLINGLTLQGVTFEMASNEIYMALDHGRSYDDAWRNTDPTRDRLRQLKETFFFQDPQDLNPRKLTSVKVGFGLPEGTHVHIGMLRGSREGFPFGAPADATLAFRQLNHVVELDAGVKVAEGHMARFALGRSIMSEVGASGKEESEGLGGLMDRRERKNQAVQLGWQSRFKATRTEVDLTGRMVDPYFQSLGVGFLRSGTRTIDGTVDQAVGKKLRLQGTYRIEERDRPGTESEGMLLQRWRVRATYRAFQWLTLRSSYAPIVATVRGGDGEDVRQRSSVLQLGGDVRKRYGTAMAAIMIDASRYQREDVGIEGGRTEAWYLMGGCTWTGEHLTVTASLSSFVDEADSSGSSLSMDLRIAHRSKNGIEWSAGATGYMDPVPDMGWDLASRFPISDRISIMIGAGRLVQPGHFSIDDLGAIDNGAYTCRMSIGFKW